VSAPSQSALQAEAEARLRFEMLLADVCAQFVNVAASDLDSKIEDAQRVICESLRVDHSSVWQVSEENSDLLVMTHVYRDPNLKPLPLHPNVKEYFPWSSSKILDKEIVCVPNTATLPPEATKDKESWEQYGIHSSLVFPLSVGGGSLIGVLAFDNMEAHDWPEPLQRRLQILAHVFAQALDRKHVEQKVRESESRFRLVADTAPVMIWMSGLDTKPTYFNQLWLDFTGLSETDLLNGLAGIVHPEDYLQCHDVYCRGFDQRQPFRKECRLRRHDGQYRWMLDIGVPRFHKDGSFAGYIGSCIDVTDRKLAEDALTNMSGKLLEAQEKERARIARELHDDINQRLALLGVDLGQAEENHPELPPDVLDWMHNLQRQTMQISSDVEALSHELHSSKLEYLGAIGGMKGWCKEFSEHQGLQIEFKSPESQISLPQEVGLCLFRVLQEALHNAAKHSGVKRIEVQLREDSGQIHLVVSDSGRGFDRETAMQGRGLGLASMQERVRLVNGTIEIQSKPMGGTTIHVRVPFGSEKFSERAVG
jgi:PAS domain S-box-containing protein